jgi:hypothetical protein
MDIKKNLMKFGPLVAFAIIIALIITGWILYVPIKNKPPIPGERKAIILASANDCHKSEGEDDFNEGDNANFSAESSSWTWSNQTNGYGGPDNNYQNGHDGLPGALQLIAQSNGYVYMEFVYNWTKFHTLNEYATYNLSAWINISTYTGIPVVIMPPGAGVRVGLRWLNSSNNVVRTDWSMGIYDTLGQWDFLYVTGICDNSTENEITQLQLVLSVEGIMNSGEQVLFDDVRVERWISVNVTNPINPIPPPGNIDSDGFPAQALYVYWILRNKGYTDDNIFLMLYHTGDSIIDIDANDGIPNDLVGAVIDVENDDVNSSRFIQELDVDFEDSFASNLTGRDQLIIYMVDHGSNKYLGDGNATFHFEADNSVLNETKFSDLVSKIPCRRMLINIDICFSGNFLNENSNFGLSWYNLPNSILITSTTDLFSWYWANNANQDGFAGSWFFHHFWDQLDQNQTISEAFDFAKNWIPSGQVKTLDEIQAPLIEDKLGISDTWSFNSSQGL